jgi:squalene synthase HpnD
MTVSVPLLQAANAHEVVEQVKNSGSSFLLGMMAVPGPRRRAMFGLYAFCRAVDDIADNFSDEQTRVTLLQEWRGHVEALFKGQATHPVMELLLPGAAEFSLRKEDFLAIIEGMEMDAAKVIFCPSWDELDTYCDRVASAVGRVSVCIFGENTPTGVELAYHLGRALQLTNILRDIDEDAGRGRVYLPREALEEAGVPTDSVDDIIIHPALDLACRTVARQAAQHFDEADAALAKCQKRKVKAARLMRDYYERLLYRLLLQGWKMPRFRVSLGLFDKLKLLVRTWLP